MDGLQKALNYLFTDRKKARFQIYRRLLEDQFAEPRKQETMLKENIRTLLDHSFSHVPYYKKIIKNMDVKATEWQTDPIRFLKNFPILSRQQIHNNRNELLSTDYQKRNPYPNASGGSSGMPVHIIQDEFFFENGIAHQLLANHWHGMDPFDSIVKIWGAEKETYSGRKPLLSFIKDFLRNRYVLNSFDLSPSRMYEIIRILNKKKPKLILAYVDSIYQIARFAREKNIRVKPQQAIHCGAGTLYDFMRKEIETVFQCPVYNHYGTREMSSIASECREKHGLHLFVQNVYTEIVDSKGNPCPPGKEGRILVTGLNNFSMPLIRYEIGDIGVLENSGTCSCGCTYPKIRKVIGRSTELIKAADGKIIIPEFFIHLIGVSCNDGSIHSFQVIQKDLNIIEVKIVKHEPFKDSILNKIKSKIKIVMGSECKVIFNFVENIPKTPTGKYKYVINEMV